MRHLTAEPLTEPLAHHGEGPVWDPRLGRVLWVDMLAGRVLVTDLEGRSTSRPIPDPVAALVRLRRHGGHVVVGESTVWFTDLADSASTPSAQATLPLPPKTRANDGGCAPNGELYVGTMAYDATPRAGGVFRWSADGSITPCLRDVTVANGLRFLDDESVAFIDSPTRQLRRYRVGGTEWRDDGKIADLDFGDASPDGMCMDADGGFWIAFWDGGCVRRVDASGRVTHIVDVPVQRPTSCALVGPDLSTLVITTSAYGLAQPEKHAGALLAIDVDVSGLLEPMLDH
jgi:sugar lactone lactonase YvrE